MHVGLKMVQKFLGNGLAFSFTMTQQIVENAWSHFTSKTRRSSDKEQESKGLDKVCTCLVRGFRTLVEEKILDEQEVEHSINIFARSFISEGENAVTKKSTDPRKKRMSDKTPKRQRRNSRSSPAGSDEKTEAVSENPLLMLKKTRNKTIAPQLESPQKPKIQLDRKQTENLGGSSIGHENLNMISLNVAQEDVVNGDLTQDVKTLRRSLIRSRRKSVARQDSKATQLISENMDPLNSTAKTSEGTGVNEMGSELVSSLYTLSNHGEVDEHLRSLAAFVCKLMGIKDHLVVPLCMNIFHAMCLLPESTEANCMNIFNGVLLVGSAYCGKTTILKVLTCTLKLFIAWVAHTQGSTKFKHVSSFEVGRIYTHAAFLEDLIGNLNDILLEFFSGSSTLASFDEGIYFDNFPWTPLSGVAQDIHAEWKLHNAFDEFLRVITRSKWIIFDGKLKSTDFAETFIGLSKQQSYNRVRSSNGNSLLPIYSRFLFEGIDLANASPGLCLSCKIVSVQETLFSWDAISTKLFVGLSDLFAPFRDRVEGFCNWAIPSLLNAAVKPTATSTHCRTGLGFERSSLWLLNSFLSMTQTLLTENEAQIFHETDPEDVYIHIECTIVFSSIWTFGGMHISSDSHIFLGDQNLGSLEFNSFFLKNIGNSISLKFPKEGNIYDYCYDFQRSSWVSWKSCALANNAQVAIGMVSKLPQSIILLSPSQYRACWLFMTLMLNKQNVLCTGPAGSGKSALLNTLLKNVPKVEPKWSAVKLTQAANCSSGAIIRNILGCLQRQRHNVFVPPGAITVGGGFCEERQFVLFIDDLNHDSEETECLRQLAETNSVYLSRHQVMLKSMHIVAGHQVSRNSKPDLCRLALRFDHAIQFPVTSPEVVRGIFNSIQHAHVEKNEDSVNLFASIQTLIESSLYVQMRLKKHDKCDRYKPNDVLDILRGILWIKPDVLRTNLRCIHSWIHESLRRWGYNRSIIRILEHALIIKGCDHFERNEITYAFEEARLKYDLTNEQDENGEATVIDDNSSVLSSDDECFDECDFSHAAIILNDPSKESLFEPSARYSNLLQLKYFQSEIFRENVFCVSRVLELPQLSESFSSKGLNLIIDNEERLLLGGILLQECGHILQHKVHMMKPFCNRESWKTFLRGLFMDVATNAGYKGHLLVINEHDLQYSYDIESIFVDIHNILHTGDLCGLFEWDKLTLPDNDMLDTQRVLLESVNESIPNAPEFSRFDMEMNAVRIGSFRKLVLERLKVALVIPSTSSPLLSSLDRCIPSTVDRQLCLTLIPKDADLIQICMEIMRHATKDQNGATLPFLAPIPGKPGTDISRNGEGMRDLLHILYNIHTLAGRFTKISNNARFLRFVWLSTRTILQLRNNLHIEIIQLQQASKTVDIMSVLSLQLQSEIRKLEPKLQQLKAQVDERQVNIVTLRKNVKQEEFKLGRCQQKIDDKIAQVESLREEMTNAIGVISPILSEASEVLTRLPRGRVTELANSKSRPAIALTIVQCLYMVVENESVTVRQNKLDQELELVEEQRETIGDIEATALVAKLEKEFQEKVYYWERAKTSQLLQNPKLVPRLLNIKKDEISLQVIQEVSELLNGSDTIRHTFSNLFEEEQMFSLLERSNGPKKSKYIEYRLVLESFLQWLLAVVKYKGVIVSFAPKQEELQAASVEQGSLECLKRDLEHSVKVKQKVCAKEENILAELKTKYNELVQAVEARKHELSRAVGFHELFGDAVRTDWARRLAKNTTKEEEDRKTGILAANGILISALIVYAPLMSVQTQSEALCEWLSLLLENKLKPEICSGKYLIPLSMHELKLSVVTLGNDNDNTSDDEGEAAEHHLTSELQQLELENALPLVPLHLGSKSRLFFSVGCALSGIMQYDATIVWLEANLPYCRELLAKANILAYLFLESLASGKMIQGNLPVSHFAVRVPFLEDPHGFGITWIKAYFGEARCMFVSAGAGSEILNEAFVKAKASTCTLVITGVREFTCAICDVIFRYLTGLNPALFSLCLTGEKEAVTSGCLPSVQERLSVVSFALYENEGERAVAFLETILSGLDKSRFSLWCKYVPKRLREKSLHKETTLKCLEVICDSSSGVFKSLERERKRSTTNNRRSSKAKKEAVSAENEGMKLTKELLENEDRSKQIMGLGTASVKCLTALKQDSFKGVERLQNAMRVCWTFAYFASRLYGAIYNLYRDRGHEFPSMQRFRGLVEETSRVLWAELDPIKKGGGGKLALLRVASKLRLLKANEITAETSNVFQVPWNRWEELSAHLVYKCLPVYLTSLRAQDKLLLQTLCYIELYRIKYVSIKSHESRIYEHVVCQHLLNINEIQTPVSVATPVIKKHRRGTTSQKQRKSIQNAGLSFNQIREKTSLLTIFDRKLAFEIFTDSLNLGITEKTNSDYGMHERIPLQQWGEMLKALFVQTNGVVRLKHRRHLEELLQLARPIRGVELKLVDNPVQYLRDEIGADAESSIKRLVVLLNFRPDYAVASMEAFVEDFFQTVVSQGQKAGTIATMAHLGKSRARKKLRDLDLRQPLDLCEYIQTYTNDFEPVVFMTPSATIEATIELIDEACMLGLSGEPLKVIPGESFTLLDSKLQLLEDLFETNTCLLLYEGVTEEVLVEIGNLLTHIKTKKQHTPPKEDEEDEDTYWRVIILSNEETLKSSFATRVSTVINSNENLYEGLDIDSQVQTIFEEWKTIQLKKPAGLISNQIALGVCFFLVVGHIHTGKLVRATTSEHLRIMLHLSKMLEEEWEVDGCQVKSNMLPKDEYKEIDISTKNIVGLNEVVNFVAEMTCECIPSNEYKGILRLALSNIMSSCHFSFLKNGGQFTSMKVFPWAKYFRYTHENTALKESQNWAHLLGYAHEDGIDFGHEQSKGILRILSTCLNLSREKSLHVEDAFEKEFRRLSKQMSIMLSPVKMIKTVVQDDRETTPVSPTTSQFGLGLWSAVLNKEFKVQKNSKAIEYLEALHGNHILASLRVSPLVVSSFTNPGVALWSILDLYAQSNSTPCKVCELRLGYTFRPVDGCVPILVLNGLTLQGAVWDIERSFVKAYSLPSKSSFCPKLYIFDMAKSQLESVNLVLPFNPFGLHSEVPQSSLATVECNLYNQQDGSHELRFQLPVDPSLQLPDQGIPIRLGLDQQTTKQKE